MLITLSDAGDATALRLATQPSPGYVLVLDILALPYTSAGLCLTPIW